MSPSIRAGKPGTRYRQLDAANILATIDRLEARVRERFPDAGLARLAHEFRAMAGEAVECVAYLQRPHWAIRAGAALLIAALLALLVMAAWTLRVPARVEGWGQLVQVIESAVNDVVFVGVAIFFLLTVETRIKRRRALATLHELRSVAHIVDMHQLTKDPERLLSTQPDTASSPARAMGPGELGRYLDYCSELLSLASKVAALFMQQLNDPVVLAAVNEIETLVAGLSNKIWQKITLLERVPETTHDTRRSSAAETGHPAPRDEQMSPP